jgi:type 1 glutamine amidotransferase
MSTLSRRLFTFSCLSLAIGFAGTARAADPVKVLIIDGQNNHNWQAMTPPIKKALEETGRFTVDVATTPPAKSDKAVWDRFRPDFSKYDVVMSNYNGERWPEPVEKSFEEFVKNGGGAVIVHAANNAFEGWGAYNDMIGLGWRGADFGNRVTVDDNGKVAITPKGEGPGAGHGAPHVYKIRAQEPDHPILKGLPREWLHAKDELYHGQRGPAKDMRILATAYSDASKGGTGANEPMLWTIPFGKGRVVTDVMGHTSGDDIIAIRCVGFLTVLERATEWAATGKVTLPVPANFPDAEKVSLTGEETK